MYFWLKKALNGLRNAAERLTSGANTPAPSDWPRARGRSYSSPGRGWLPNNPEAQASLLCWGQRHALQLKAENFCLASLTALVFFFFLFFSFCHFTHQEQRARAGNEVLRPIQQRGTSGLHFMYFCCFLRKSSRCRSMGVKGMQVFKGLETGCQIALQQSSLIPSFPRPGVCG